MAVPTLHGTPVFVEGADGESVIITGFTTTVPTRAYVAVLSNGLDATGVTGASLTFAQRAVSTAGDNIALWSANAPSSITNQSLTVNFGPPGSGFITAVAFAVAGQNGFDVNASLPDIGNDDPRLVDTTATETFVIGAFRYGGTEVPTAAASWSIIHAGGFMGVFYRTFTSPQTGLSVPAGGSGAGDANGGIADALQAAAGGGPSIAAIVQYYQRLRQNG